MTYSTGVSGSRTAIAVLIGMVAWQCPMVCMGGETVADEAKVLVDFQAPNEIHQWRIINDGVMGGLSRSSIEIVPPRVAVFEGSLSLENNGGFASVRRMPHEYGLRGYAGVLLRVRGDGRTYQLRVRTDERSDGVSYAGDMVTEAGQWMTVRIPFSSLRPTFRGQPVPTAPVLRAEDVCQIGFLIGDKREGIFRIEIESIQAYRLQDNEETPDGEPPR